MELILIIDLYGSVSCSHIIFKSHYNVFFRNNFEVYSPTNPVLLWGLDFLSVKYILEPCR